jgi:hypothetical protein
VVAVLIQSDCFHNQNATHAGAASRNYEGVSTTTSQYADFAAREAHFHSPMYERLALAVTRDNELLERLGSLPGPKRQPNLLFAVVRHLDGPLDDTGWIVANWDRIEPQMRSRATQTNEVGRCAVLLPVLYALPQPLALLEVGASAGLNLFPDRYSYRYGSHRLGEGDPLLACDLTGTPPPAQRPEVVWRAGIDLNPLDVTDPDDARWLESLIWPEHDHRRARLRAAMRIAAADPPLLARGDLLDDLPALAAQAPEDATLVIFHTSVLYQVPSPRRQAFLDLVRHLPAHWIAAETPDVVEYGPLPAEPDASLHNVLALDGRPLAWAASHGQAVRWFAPARG